MTQSKPSFVYFVQKHPKGAIKIGVAIDVPNRVKQLQTGSDQTLRILATFPGDEKFEKFLHEKFGAHRIRDNGEWFLPHPDLMDFLGDHFRRYAKAEPLELKIEVPRNLPYCKGCYDESPFVCAETKLRNLNVSVFGSSKPHHNCDCHDAWKKIHAPPLVAADLAIQAKAAREAMMAALRKPKT